jgi:hemolysin III
LSTATPRPRLRGVSHRIAFYVTVIAGSILVANAPDRRSRIATLVYVCLLAGMFGVSATLHRRDWGPRAYGLLRRADHAMIFACIAGTYTPFCVLALGLDTPGGSQLLALAWAAAGLGILRALLWPHAPRVITSTLFVIVGWVAVGHVSDIHAALDPVAFGFLVAGGIVLTIGAVVYLVRRPDPWPEVFGYHEVFHMIVNLGIACHFVAVTRVVMTGR